MAKKAKPARRPRRSRSEVSAGIVRELGMSGSGLLATLAIKGPTTSNDLADMMGLARGIVQSRLERAVGEGRATFNDATGKYTATTVCRSKQNGRTPARARATEK